MVVQPVHGGWDSDPGSETSLSALYGGAWPASPSAYVQPTGNASPRRLMCQGLAALTPKMFVSHNPYLPSTSLVPGSEVSGEGAQG